MRPGPFVARRWSVKWTWESALENDPVSWSSETDDRLEYGAYGSFEAGDDATGAPDVVV